MHFTQFLAVALANAGLLAAGPIVEKKHDSKRGGPVEFKDLLHDTNGTLIPNDSLPIYNGQNLTLGQILKVGPYEHAPPSDICGSNLAYWAAVTYEDGWIVAEYSHDHRSYCHSTGHTVDAVRIDWCPGYNAEQNIWLYRDYQCQGEPAYHGLHHWRGDIDGQILAWKVNKTQGAW